MTLLPGVQQPGDFVQPGQAGTYYEPVGLEDWVIVPVGAFADPQFPPPTVSVYEERMHGWVVPPAHAEHLP